MVPVAADAAVTVRQQKIDNSWITVTKEKVYIFAKFQRSLTIHNKFGMPASGRRHSQCVTRYARSDLRETSARLRRGICFAM